MTTVEELIAKLGLDTSQFKEGMVQSGEAVNKLNEKMEALQKGFAAGAIGEFVHKVLENADALVSMSENLDVSTDSLQALTVAAGKHQVKAEDVQAVWAKSRDSLDKLRAGNEETARTFAALGLTVEDFKGLALDESLEKIARAYTENADRAGAYDALQQLIGKSGRNLVATLKEVGEEGLGGLIAKFKESHELIDGTTLKDLAETNNKWEEIGNTIKVGAAAIVGWIHNIMTAVGTMAGGLVELGSALLKGGPFTEAGRAQMKATWEALKDINQQLEEKHSGMAESAHKTAEAHKEMLPPLVEAKELTEARKKYEEAVAKAALEGLSTADKMALIEEQLAKFSGEAAAAKKDSVDYYKAAAEVARLTGEYAKLEREDVEATLTADLKRLEQSRAVATIYEQRALIQKEINLAAAASIELERQGLDTSKADEAIAKSKHDLKMLDHKLAEDEVKAAADLFSQDKQTAENAKVHLELLTGQKTQVQAMGEIQMLLAKGVANLTEEEKLHLTALVNNLTVEQKRAQIALLMAKGVNNLTDDEKQLLAVYSGQLAVLQNQKGTIDQIANAWENVMTVVDRTGSPYSSQSTVALEGLQKRLQSQINPLGESPGAGLSGVAATPAYLAYLANQNIKSELAQIEAELASRAQVSGYLSSYGENAARGQFGDEATNKAMQDLSATSKQSAANIQTVADVLTGKRQIFGG